MIVCTRCDKEKEDSKFRIRTDKRRNPPLIYVNNVCKDCESEISKERVRNQRKTEEGRKRHNKWAMASYQRNREKNIHRMREARKTPEYKAYMKEYRKRRKEIIQQQEQVTKRKYHEKHRDAVTDSYAIRLLVTQGFGTYEEIEKQRELIDLKKVQILTKRLKMKVSQLKKKI